MVLALTWVCVGRLDGGGEGHMSRMIPCLACDEGGALIVEHRTWDKVSQERLGTRGSTLILQGWEQRHRWANVPQQRMGPGTQDF
jgi:hypothetical protein